MPAWSLRFHGGESYRFLSVDFFIAKHAAITDYDSHEEEHLGWVSEEGNGPGGQDIEDADAAVKISDCHTHYVGCEEVDAG